MWLKIIAVLRLYLYNMSWNLTWNENFNSLISLFTYSEISYLRKAHRSEWWTMRNINSINMKHDTKNLMVKSIVDLGKGLSSWRFPLSS